MKSFRILALTLSIVAAKATYAAPRYDHDPNIIEELRIRDGLPNVFKKLESNQPVTVLYLGGSITHAEGWRPKTFAWLESQNPDAQLTQVDAAVPGTGADFAACRYVQDVLPHKPDLVFVEYRVNCGGGVEARAIDGIIRQLWEANPETDICFVYTIGKWMIEEMEEGGKQHFFGKIMEETANYYGIPSIDLAPEVLKRKRAGTLIFQAPEPFEGKLHFSKDGVHPGDAGHELYKELIARSLTAMKGVGAPGPHSLPPPLEKQHLRDATFIPISAAETRGSWSPVDSATDAVYGGGYLYRTSKMLSDAIKCSEEGASFTVNWTGTRLTLTHIPQGKGMEILVATDGSSSKRYALEQRKEGRISARFTSLPELPQGNHTTTVTISKLPEGAAYYAGQFMLVRDPIESRSVTDSGSLRDKGLCELAGLLRPGFLVGAHTKPEQVEGGKATEILLHNYSMVSAGIYQRQTQRRSRDGWSFSSPDPIIAFANKHGIQVYAHPMFGSDGYLPDWLLEGKHSDKECLEIVEERIKTILTRYRGRIQILDVYNEGLERRTSGWREDENLLVRLGYRENEEGRWPVILEKILVWCRKYGGEELKLIYNDNSNTLLGMPQSEECIRLVRALRKAGIPIDGIGIQCHTKITRDGRHELGGHEKTRSILFDADLFARNLEAFREAGIDVHISECDVHLYGEVDERKLQLQADAYRSILEVCIKEPACKSFKTWGFTDASCWKPMSKGNWSYKYEPYPLVFDHDLRPKPAYHAMQELLVELIEREREDD